MHPALSEALATAHKEDLQRAAARSHATRIARDALQERQLEEPSIAGRRSAWARLRGLRAAGLRHNTNRDPANGPAGMPTCPRRPVRAATRDRPGIE